MQYQTTIVTSPTFVAAFPGLKLGEPIEYRELHHLVCFMHNKLEQCISSEDFFAWTTKPENTNKRIDELFDLVEDAKVRADIPNRHNIQNKTPLPNYPKITIAKDGKEVYTHQSSGPYMDTKAAIFYVMQILHENNIENKNLCVSAELEGGATFTGTWIEFCNKNGVKIEETAAPQTGPTDFNFSSFDGALESAYTNTTPPQYLTATIEIHDKIAPFGGEMVIALLKDGRIVSGMFNGLVMSIRDFDNDKWHDAKDVEKWFKLPDSFLKS